MTSENQSITQVEISGFRGLDSLKIEKTGLINILVGNNGVGKTSVLEAIHMACSGNQPMEFVNVNYGRGLSAHGTTLIADAFFNQFNTNKKPKCALTLANGKKQSIEMSWEQPMAVNNIYIPKEQNELTTSATTQAEKVDLGSLTLTYSHPTQGSIESTQHKSIIDFIQNGMSTRRQAGCTHCIVSKFLSFKVQVNNDPAKLYSELERKGNKLSFDEMLRQVDMRVESINVTAETTPPSLTVKLKNNATFLPIALLGDGMQRAMQFATFFYTPNIKVLCIDEIDAGLHRDAMQGLWQAIYSVCKEKSIQLFCTTHDEQMITAAIEAIEAVEGDKCDLYVQKVIRRDDGSIVVRSQDCNDISNLQQANFDIMA